MRTLVRCLVIALLGWARLHAQAVLEPPFGLRWGDTPEKLIEWAARHSLDVNISLPGDQPALRILKISARKGNLPGAAAQTLEGRFHTGRLYEVTVHYRDPAAKAEEMEVRFNKLRKELTGEYGALSANRQDRNIKDQFATRTLSFHREPVKGLFLLLAYTEIEDQLRKTRDATFSLLYRNDNLRQDLEKLATPGGGQGPGRGEKQ
ncbi:hypothetical protein OKA04_17860 [Luteolibacter flavescens]|uniref:DUF4349 domain-containing protein n=1 Tax=Luteolibacter flavescens TaxID=1859460 RepID=A0ABT3FTQ8_9BACT|nr:hypothetical protein [Luteolibacter flavescens]MCW1886609.1 hypothetical protein [Luteolibacter flavescens]